MQKGCIWYSDGHLDSIILSVCQKQLKNSFDGEIVSVTLQPIDFGRNIVLENRSRGYPTMIMQILTALENSTADIIFFCEHDILYAKEHFDFVPPLNDTYYYNMNNWRWRWGTDIAITYDRLTSLSMMCCNRELALQHYRKRVQIMKEKGYDKLSGKDPQWARKWGYEPGKSKRRGGLMDERVEYWRSEVPNIDIRHSHTFSPPKTSLEEFKHKPSLETWKEENVFNISGWDLKSLFNL